MTENNVELIKKRLIIITGGIDQKKNIKQRL